MKKLALVLSLFAALSSGSPSSSVSAAPLAAPGGTLDILVIGDGGGNQAVNAVIASGDLPGTVTRTFDVAAFNAQTPAQLRASYDIIFVSWLSDPAFNLDWASRTLPFLQLGGSVIHEDPSNLDDLAPAVSGFQTSNSFGYSVSPVPGLTDGINDFFVNDHLGLSAWDSGIFTPFIQGFGYTTGIYGRVPNGGRIIVTGPDQDYHALKFGSAQENNQYNFLINELKWAGSGSMFSDLRSGVTSLIGPGKLTQRYADTLIQLLNRAEARALAGDEAQAVSLIRSFQSYVNRAQASGWITAGEASSLITGSNALIALL